jgi:hypothetical protein
MNWTKWRVQIDGETLVVLVVVLGGILLGLLT